MLDPGSGLGCRVQNQKLGLNVGIIWWHNVQTYWWTVSVYGSVKLNVQLFFYLSHLSLYCLTCLSLTCPQVRAELQSCVSRQQEALRSREVWLLSQIELLEQVKTETLQQQLHQLHWVNTHWLLIGYWLVTDCTCYLLPISLLCFSSGDSLTQSPTSCRTPTAATTWTTSWPAAWRSKYWATCLFWLLLVSSVSRLLSSLQNWPDYKNDEQRFTQWLFLFFCLWSEHILLRFCSDSSSSAAQRVLICSNVKSDSIGIFWLMAQNS